MSSSIFHPQNNFRGFIEKTFFSNYLPETMLISMGGLEEEILVGSNPCLLIFSYNYYNYKFNILYIQEKKIKGKRKETNSETIRFNFKANWMKVPKQSHVLSFKENDRVLFSSSRASNYKFGIAICIFPIRRATRRKLGRVV